MPFWLVWPILGAIAGHVASPSEEERIVRALIMAAVALLLYVAWRLVRWLLGAGARAMRDLPHTAGRATAHIERSARAAAQAFRDGRND